MSIYVVTNILITNDRIKSRWDRLDIVMTSNGGQILRPLRKKIYDIIARYSYESIFSIYCFKNEFFSTSSSFKVVSNTYRIDIFDLSILKTFDRPINDVDTKS